MAAYEQYKDSGVKWLGKIPSHWEVRRIKWLFNEVNIPNSNLQYPLLSFSKTKGIVLSSDIKDKESSSDLSKYKIIKPGQLLENRLQAWNGMFACSNIEGCVSPDYSVFEAIDENVNTEFFAYVFRLPAWVQQFANLSTGVGSGFNRLYTPQFYSVFTVFPPINEQNAIVEYLKTVTGEIDRAIEVQQQMIDALNERIQIIISNAVTKGLNPDAPLRDSGIDWLGQIPEHWEIRRIKFSATLSKDKTSEILPYVALENIEGFTGKLLGLSNEQPDSQCNLFEKGDVLFNKLRPYLAKCFIAEFAGKASSELLVLRDFNGDNKYLKYLLLSAELIDLINSSTYGAKMPRANWSFIGNCYIPIPPIEEQNNIVEHIDFATADLNKQIENCQRMIDLLTERKQIIINQVVTGKEKVI